MPKKKDNASIGNRIEKMQEFIRIASIESCLQIYSYLLIFGQTTPAKLRDVTGLSKATMFRNLALLSSAGILDKEAVDSTPDKRYSLHYHINRDLLKTMKALYSKEAEVYARERGMTRVIADYGRALEGLPLDLNRICNELILHCPEESSDEDEGVCLVVRKLLTFRVGEAGNLQSLVEDITGVMKAFEGEKSSVSRNMKKPLERPAIISISLATVETDETPIPADALALKRDER